MDLIYGTTPFEPIAGSLLETGTGLAFLAYLPDTSEGLLFYHLQMTSRNERRIGIWPRIRAHFRCQIPSQMCLCLL
ncbi:hypothetical protein JW859_05560 [bacterium]|nr:hypothetical protein [bacterium]